MVTPRALAAALTMLLAAPRAASAHPLHSTITELVADRAHGTVRATIRVFLDDFTTAVRKSTHDRVSPNAGAAWDAASLAYVGAAFGLTERTGRRLPLRSCGVKRTADLLWICVETSAALESLAVRDAMLCDLFDDQVNVVQATVGLARRSLLFTRGDRAKPLL
jgi:hypothetical protein